MENIKKSYFGEFFKKAYYIPTLFFIAIITSLVAIDYKYSIIANIRNNGLFLFFAISFGYYCIFIIGNFASNIKKNKIVPADAIAFALTLSSMAYIIILTILIKSFSLIKLLFIIYLLVISITYIILRIIFFPKESKQSTVFYTKNNLNGYILAFAKRFSFITVLLYSVGLFLFAFIILDSKVSLFVHDGRFVLYCILIGIAIAILIVGSNFKRINLLDPTLMALLIALPPIFLYIALIKDDTNKVQYFVEIGITTALCIFFYFIRFISFDISKIEKSTAVSSSKCPVLNYYKPYDKKFSILLTICAVALFTLLSFYMVKFIPLIKAVLNGSENPSYAFMSVAIVTLIAYGTFLFGLIFSLCNIRSPKITYGDFFTNFNVLFGSISVFVFNNVATDYDRYICLFILVYSLTILIARARFRYNTLTK